MLDALAPLGVVNALLDFGDEAQHEAWLPRFASEAPVPAALQARADLEQDLEAPREHTSFCSLLAELDSMETGLKTDFDDLRDETEQDLPVSDEDRRDY